MNDDLMRQQAQQRLADQARRAHEQMAQQQHDGWRRMNEAWDRQQHAAAARASGDLGPATFGDRVGVVVGTVVLLLVVGGSFFAWTQLREGDGAGAAARTGQSGTTTGPGSAGEPGPDGGDRGGGGQEGGIGGKVVEEVEVPDVGALSREKATRVLVEAGFQVEAAYDEDVPFCPSDQESWVAVQEPAEGEAAPRGSRVRIGLQLSDGHGSVVVPRLTGLEATQAEDLMGEYVPVVRDVEDGDVEEGEFVVGVQSPSPCERVDAESDKVTIGPGEGQQ